MATMGPMEYARHYWGLEVPIINDDNEIVRYERVKFGKYRLYQGWGQTPPVPPPGLRDFQSAVGTYAHGLFKQGKALELIVKNIWGETTFLTLRTTTETTYRRILWRSSLPFSGKGSPEDVQLTLQLAARCGIAANGLQQYCDESVDTYSRLGIDCNGFVGNYLCFRDTKYTWRLWEQNVTTPDIHGETGIKLLVEKLAPQPVINVNDMLAPRVHVFGMVDGSGTVVNGGFGPVGHIMITQAFHWGMQEVLPPVPKQYVGGRYLCYSGVEATPAVGLADFKYTILNIADNGVATVWRDKVFSPIKVKIYPVG